MMFELKIPPPVYMLLTGALMWILDKVCPIYQLLFDPWNQVGYLFMLVGLSFDAGSLLHFFQAKTTVSPLKPDEARHLVTTGTYRFTRNPMYLGLLLLLIGFACLKGSIITFLLIPIFVILLTKQQIIPEETILEEKFGQQYLDYKKSVRRWL